MNDPLKNSDTTLKYKLNEKGKVTKFWIKITQEVNL